MKYIKRLLSAAAAVLMLISAAVTVTAAAKRGDVNSSGDINMKDLTELQRNINGWENEIDEYAADTDGNGEINMKDLTLLQRYINGWDVTLAGPAEPKIVGYVYKYVPHDAVTTTGREEYTYYIDSYGIITKWRSFQFNGCQLKCTGWDWLVKEINAEHGTTITASYLKSEYEKGQVTFLMEMPGCNVSEKTPEEWFKRRLIELRHYVLENMTSGTNYKICNTAESDEIWANKHLDWEKNGYSSSFTNMFEYARLLTGGGYITGNTAVLKWNEPFTEVTQKAYAEVQRIGEIYDNGTTSYYTNGITVATTLDPTFLKQEKTFLKNQGLKLDTSDPVWAKYFAFLNAN